MAELAGDLFPDADARGADGLAASWATAGLALAGDERGNRIGVFWPQIGRMDWAKGLGGMSVRRIVYREALSCETRVPL